MNVTFPAKKTSTFCTHTLIDNLKITNMEFEVVVIMVRNKVVEFFIPPSMAYQFISYCSEFAQFQRAKTC